MRKGVIVGLSLIGFSIFWLPVSMAMAPGISPGSKVYISLVPALLLFLAGVVLLITSLTENVLRSLGFIKDDSDLP